MSRAHLYADEAGCFAFKRGPNVSNYFTICTVMIEDHGISDDLLALRRDLAWKQMPLSDYFHATTDRQSIRDRVFEIISRHKIRIDATLLEKPKANPSIRTSDEKFYRYAWLYHFRYIVNDIMRDKTELLVCAASIGKAKKKAAFTSAVNDVVSQHMSRHEWRTFFAQAMSDPCLQVADYCAWAIQRKWERNDLRSYNLIAKFIATEFDLFERGSTLYY